MKVEKPELVKEEPVPVHEIENIFDTTEYTTASPPQFYVSSEEESDVLSLSSQSLTTTTPRVGKEDMECITNNRMLTDNVIFALQKILQKQHPQANGLQDPVLGQCLTFNVYKDTPFVQVLHNGNYHWLAVSTYGCQSGEVFVMDSLFRGRLTQHTQKQICSLLCCKESLMKVKVLPVQQQTNGVDCGLFAVAFVQYILMYGKNPINTGFAQSKLRQHVLKSFKDGKLSLFPTSSEATIKFSKGKEVKLELFCSCRMIWSPCDKNTFGR